MDKLIYLIYPVLLIILLWGAKFVGRKSWNDDWMSLSQTKALQGFIAICIMVHHCSQKTCAPWLVPRVRMYGLEPFVLTGYIFVGFFLFSSGYGLYKSYKNKPNYLQGFCRRRIVPVVTAFYLTAFIFLIVRFCMGEHIGMSQLIYYVTGLKLCNPNSWFVVALPFFYLGFFFSFRYIKNEKLAVFLSCLVVFVYTFIGTCCDHNDFWMRGQWWYNSVHFFPIGLLFARYEKTITEKIKRRYLLYLVLSLVTFVVFYRVSKYTQNVFSYYGEDFNANFKVLRRWVCLLSEIIESCGFVFFVFLLGLKVKIGNKVLAFMGAMTMEFYLIHGLFIEFFGYSFLDMRSSLYYIRNVALFILVVTVCSIPSALLVKKLNGLLQFKKKTNKD